MAIKQLLENIQRGKQGKNIGISTGKPKLDSIIYGIQRKYLYTIGADSSGGKTSFALDVYIYNLLKNASDKDVSILYYSFEMSEDVLQAKLLSQYIWDTFGEVVTFKDILSYTDTLSEKHEELINKSIDWLESVDKKLMIYDKALTPNAIYATCKRWLSNFGDFVKIDEHREEYVDKNPDKYKVVLIDHVGLIAGPDSKKVKIDTTVDFFIYFRNKCSITGVFIQQMNRNAKSMDRKLNSYELYQLDDFKDTSGTTDASEVVMALYFPYREKIPKCEGYPIQNTLKKRFRLCMVLKNRYGIADINIGLNFFGEIGKFNELPKPEEITDYTPYLELIKQEVKPDKKEVSDEKKEIIFNLRI